MNGRPAVVNSGPPADGRFITAIRRRIRALTARVDPANVSPHQPDMRTISHTGAGLTCTCARCGSPLVLKVGGWRREGGKRVTECVKKD